MSRRMSVSMTLDAVRERRKTVTRRHVDTWKTLQPGDRLTLIEKGMGLPKGAKQVVVAEVEVVDVRVEPILAVNQSEIEREGFDGNSWGDLSWAAWWANGHGYRPPQWGSDGSYLTWQQEVRQALSDVQCRRIEWRYLDIWEDDDGVERIGCTWCGGDGYEECTDTLAGCGPRCTGEICPCTGCHGKGYDQWVW